ncbi:AIPR family protein [Pseudotabrizicola sp.]|uniref:AIPR family protein n=1 Tax=Pseudotabrizicola sp. TaxID=2939647 RepID=UPI002731201E|nr:AIPR family protein [Pseudotabrizicola sp.]MDP2079516.1 AIPR family protein [Pseudotabrizicola sp.]
MQHLIEFNTDLLAELRGEADDTGLPLADLAFERLCSTLEAESEIETSDRCSYRGAVSGKSLRIDGHGGDPRDSDGILSVIVCEIFDTDEPPTLNAADTKKLFGHLVNFVTAARRSEFRDGLHIESQEFGTATMIADAWSSVTKVKLILVTNGVYTARTDAVLAGKIGDVPVTYNIWDIGRLHRVETSGSKEKIVVKFAEEFGGGLPALSASGPETSFPSYLAVIRGNQLAEIYDRWGTRLLESNIRSFIQARRKSVNEGIRDTIKGEPEMFFSYNNGLSATADSVETETDGAGVRILSAKNLQIVNGGQTTASLYAALKHSPENLERVHVQMKLTVVPAETSEEIVPNISKYANSQNKVSAADFFSNHPFHMRMESYSRRVFAPPAQGATRQTRWFYERARGQYQVERANLSGADRKRFDAEHPKSQLFQKTDLAKIELSFQMKPDTVSKGAQKNFAAFATDIGAAWSASDKKYDETWFKRLVAKVIVFRALEKTIPKQEWYPGGYRANIVTYGIAKIVHDAEKLGKLLDLDRVWNEQRVPDGMLKAILSACEASANVITEPESGIRNVTEWAKKQACWSSVSRLEIDYIEGLDDHLVAPQDAKSVERDGKRAAAEISGIEAQSKVIELGSAFWNRLRDWTASNRSFSLKDDGILKACSQQERRLPSEKQCVLAVDILARAREEGYLDDEETPRIRISGRARAH